MGLVETAITSHVDEYQWQAEKEIGSQERKGLLALRDAFKANPQFKLFSL